MRSFKKPAISQKEAPLRDRAPGIAERVAAFAAGRPPRASFDPASSHALAAGGWTGLLLKRAFGGAGGSIHDLCLAAEAFGRAGLVSLAPVATATGALGDAAIPPRDLIARALSGDTLILPALQSEGARPSAGHGSTAREVAGGALLLDGAKFFVPDGDRAEGFIVDARGPNGLVLLRVPRDAPGVALTSERTADGGSVARLEFKAVRCEPRDVLARSADAVAVLDRLRFALQLGLAAELVGLASRAFETTLAQASASDAATLLAIGCDIAASRALVFALARLADCPTPGLLAPIAGARAQAGDTALAAAGWSARWRGDDAKPLLARVLTLVGLYRDIAAHRRRFRDWVCGEATEAALFADGASPETAMLTDIGRLARETGAMTDVAFQDRWARAQAEALAVRAMAADPSVGAAALRAVAAAALRRRAADMLVTAAGSAAALRDRADAAGAKIDVAQFVLQAQTPLSPETEREALAALGVTR